MSENLNQKIGQETIILEEKTLKLFEYADVRCVLLEEKRELCRSALSDEITTLGRRLRMARDNAVSGLTNRVVHLKQLEKTMDGDRAIFEVKSHWYAAIDLCDFLGLRCRRYILEQCVHPDGLRMEWIKCSDGKRHLVFLVSGESLRRMASASVKPKAQRFSDIVMSYYPPVVSLEAVDSPLEAEEPTRLALEKALEVSTARNGELSRNLAGLQKEIRALERKAKLFEDIRSFVARTA